MYLRECLKQIGVTSNTFQLQSRVKLSVWHREAGSRALPTAMPLHFSWSLRNDVSFIKWGLTFDINDLIPVSGLAVP